MPLGPRLEELRHAKGWTLEKLAEETGLSDPYLSRVERDKALPSAETLVLLVKGLDGSTEDMEEVLKARERRELQERKGLPEANAEGMAILSRMTPDQARAAIPVLERMARGLFDAPPEDAGQAMPEAIERSEDPETLSRRAYR